MPTPKIPNLNDFEEYRGAVAKLAGLREQLRQTEAEIEALRTKRPPTDEERGAARTAALLAGEDFPEPENRAEQLGRLYERANDLTAAIRLQGCEVQSAAVNASESIVEGLRPRYRSLQQKMVDALQTVAALADEEAEFLEQLRDAGVSFESPLQPNGLGQLKSSAPLVAGFLAKAEATHGVRLRRPPASGGR
ncbi:hypothetical protein BH23GEM7_BH23GEM7_27120 [soil metagenome]|jgi:uncharacterized protein (DUF3084 family)